MKRSNANCAYKFEEDGEHVTLVLACQLHREDFQIIEDILKPELDRTCGAEHDLGDVVLTCLTYGIHKAYEDAEGVPFTLRMDRKKNES